MSDDRPHSGWDNLERELRERRRRVRESLAARLNDPSLLNMSATPSIGSPTSIATPLNATRMPTPPVADQNSSEHPTEQLVPTTRVRSLIDNHGQSATNVSEGILNSILSSGVETTSPDHPRGDRQENPEEVSQFADDVTAENTLSDLTGALGTTNESDAPHYEREADSFSFITDDHGGLFPTLSLADTLDQEAARTLTAMSADGATNLEVPLQFAETPQTAPNHSRRNMAVRDFAHNEVEQSLQRILNNLSTMPALSPRSQRGHSIQIGHLTTPAPLTHPLFRDPFSTPTIPLSASRTMDRVMDRYAMPSFGTIFELFSSGIGLTDLTGGRRGAIHPAVYDDDRDTDSISSIIIDALPTEARQILEGNEPDPDDPEVPELTRYIEERVDSDSDVGDDEARVDLYPDRFSRHRRSGGSSRPVQQHDDVREWACGRREDQWKKFEVLTPVYHDLARFLIMERKWTLEQAVRAAVTRSKTDRSFSAADAAANQLRYATLRNARRSAATGTPASGTGTGTRTIRTLIAEMDESLVDLMGMAIHPTAGVGVRVRNRGPQ